MDVTRTTRGLDWRLVLGLAALQLVQPLAHLTGVAGRLGRPATSATLAVAVGLTWVLLVGWSTVRRPVLTCVAAGLVFGAGAVLLAAAVPAAVAATLPDPLDGPGPVLLAVPLLVGQLGYGLVTGLLALAVQRTRLRHDRDDHRCQEDGDRR